VLNRPAGAFVKPHYHINERASRSETRHQVMVCLAGAVRIGLFATEGEHVGDVDLRAGDVALPGLAQLRQRRPARAARAQVGA
jgi:hypothetical protein